MEVVLKSMLPQTEYVSGSPVTTTPSATTAKSSGHEPVVPHSDAAAGAVFATGMASAREASVKAQRAGRNMMRLVVDGEGWIVR